MSDSGVWGISQEYFDKVYPQQELQKRKILSVPVLAEPKPVVLKATEGSEARESTSASETRAADSRGGQLTFAFLA